jgi:ATP-dependent DNA helicase UvrD/PcrA
VAITTLHSLALRILRRAGQLAAYPVDPIVLDEWEVTNIFDEEFGHVHGLGRPRTRSIRREHEAFWSTGVWGPPNYLPPDPPITDSERRLFTTFHEPRTRTYACVLPGEIIRLCVQHMESGLLDAVELLGLQHLIVDEFQDLNPMDLKFVDNIISQGATVFVAGDDDQSVYSFRFASPSGIQTFHSTYPGAGSHHLTHCFRCTPAILAAAEALIAAHSAPGRIPKAYSSLYAASSPPVDGSMHCWRFSSPRAEARAIADSCADLIENGLNPREILILLSNQRALLRPLLEELQRAEVAAEHAREEGFVDSNAGRLVLALLRIVCNPDDYVSHRALLGLRRRVGMGRCSLVFDAVVLNNLNYRSIFYDALPTGAFTGQALSTINLARSTCATIAAWEAEDALDDRRDEIHAIIEDQYDTAQAGAWQEFITELPGEMTLAELRDFLWADTDEQQGNVLQAAMVRIGLPIPTEGVLPQRVRIMTMHGAKGLSARVVFIPGLEQQIFPGPWRLPYSGLVLEAARLLYVSITRARATCVVTLSGQRVVNGTSCRHSPSQFGPSLRTAFVRRTGGLTPAEVEQILADCTHL